LPVEYIIAAAAASVAFQIVRKRENVRKSEGRFLPSGMNLN